MSDRAETHDDAETDLPYRAISLPAIIAALLGGLSVLSIWSPLFGAFGLLAIICGVFALRAIASRPQSLTGRAAALFGMALGLAFLIVPAAQLLSRDYQLRSQGERYASEWLALVRSGQLPLAHQLTLQPVHREPRGTDLRRYYQGSPRSQQEMNELFGEPHLHALVTHGADGQLAAPQVLEIHTERLFDFVVLRFDFRYTEAGRVRELPLRVVLEHSRQASDRGRWRVHSTGEIRSANTAASRL